MKRSFIVGIMALLLATGLRAQEEPKPITMAVLDFESSGEKLKGMGPDVARLLAAKLSASPSVLLVERQEIEKLLGEIELGRGGAVAADSAAKAGQMLGAQTLVTGRLFEVSGSYYVVAKVMGVETSRVYGETAVFKNEDGLNAAVDDLCKKIDTLAREKGATFLAKVETEDEFLARMQGLIKGRALPVLGVSVTEQHFGAQVPDPAVQTEICRIYQKLGGKISGEEKAAKAWIKGEAFSERGMQRGNLIACRARVEITILRSGEAPVYDRQTSAVVGLGEMTTGKEALEKAARILLERNLAKIAGE